MAAYAAVAFALGLLGAVLRYEVVHFGARAIDARALIGPLLATFGLLFITWAATVVIRNYAILTGKITGAYYVDYRYEREAPPEWVERVGRTFNNVMQLPAWFALLCLMCMSVGQTDRAQLALAWTFVALRYLHAAIYAAWNFLPARFGTYVAGMVVVIVMTYRLAAQTAALW